MNTPISSICELDGFSTITGAFTADLAVLGDGFCGGVGSIENNGWIGFTAQTNILELLITASNCSTSGQQRGIQFAIVQTDCATFIEPQQGGINPCFFFGLFNNSDILHVDNLIPGEEYYIMFDGFGGEVCEFSLEVLDGFGNSDLEISKSSLNTLCPDVLNPGEFAIEASIGALVDVNVGGNATSDLSFFWLDLNENVIAVTQGEVIAQNIVRGTLEASFFEEPGTYIVQVVDNGTCCLLYVEIPLEIATPLPAAAAVLAGSTGETDLGCRNDELIVMGEPLDTSMPVVEQWQIVDNQGVRQMLDSHLVQVDGRLDEISITRELIELHFPNQTTGEVNIVYGFLSNIDDECLSEAVVTIAFDFREPVIDIAAVSSAAIVVSAMGGLPPYTYIWNDGTMGPVIVEPVSGFSYEVTVTDANGCEDSVSSILTKVAEVLIEKNDVNLFPNPNEGAFQFSFESLLSLEEIIIYNIHGQIVYEKEDEFSNANVAFTLANLSQGTYLFEARFDQGVHRQKMIVF